MSHYILTLLAVLYAFCPGASVAVEARPDMAIAVPAESGCKMMVEWNATYGQLVYAGCSAIACTTCHEIAVNPTKVVCSCSVPGGDGSCDAWFTPPTAQLPWGAVSGCSGGCSLFQVCQQNGAPMWPEPFVLCDCMMPPLW